jgi:hypothetical protein
MRDLSDICRNIDACAQRARKTDQGGLEQELRNIIRDIGAVSKDVATPFIVAGDRSAPSSGAPWSQIIEKLRVCAARARIYDQGALAAEILNAAQDLKEWYALP